MITRLSRKATAPCAYMLAFWARRDGGRIDRLFRQSGLMREKWRRDDYREKTIANACEKSTDVWEPQRNNAPAMAEPLEELRPGYGLNDTGNADRLTAAFGDDLIYCRERRSYYVWNDKRWVFDEFLEVEKRAEQTIRRAFAEAGAIDDDKTREVFLRFLNKSLYKNSLANMVHLAKKKVRVISATELDSDPWLLNVDDGTIDLRTRELRPHHRGDLNSKLIPLKCDPAACCPLFMASIYRSMGGGPNASEEEKERADELVEYLQLLLGCAATGKPEKLLIVFHGQLGNNGKTTLLNIISKALGDQEYSTQINIDSLMADPRGAGSNNAINSDLSDLQGARFVFTSEVERGQQLSLARVKYLTGLSSIRARRMRENWISFKPVHKIFMDCNDRPVISNPTDPVWNRVVCVPFDIQIPGRKILLRGVSAATSFVTNRSSTVT